MCENTAFNVLAFITFMCDSTRIHTHTHTHTHTHLCMSSTCCKCVLKMHTIVPRVHILLIVHNGYICQWRVRSWEDRVMQVYDCPVGGTQSSPREDNVRTKYHKGEGSHYVCDIYARDLL